MSKLWPLLCVLLCFGATPLQAGTVKGVIDLNNRFVDVRRDGEQVRHGSNHNLWLEIEPGTDVGDFNITTTVFQDRKGYSAYAVCSWDNDEKTQGSCGVEEDGGQYKVIVDWGGSHPDGVNFRRLFLRVDEDGFRIGGEETDEGVGAAYTLRGTQTVNLKVVLDG